MKKKKWGDCDFDYSSYHPIKGKHYDFVRLSAERQWWLNELEELQTGYHAKCRRKLHKWKMREARRKRRRIQG